MVKFSTVICVLGVLYWNNVQAQELEFMYEFPVLDYTWPSPEHKLEAIQNKTYIPENNAPSGIKVHKGTVYLTTPRWKSGVPSTMNKVVTVDGKHLLEPYPSWDFQELDNCEMLQFAHSMEIDPDSDSMWIIDPGRRNMFEAQNRISNCPPKLVIINLKTNKVIHKYTFPENVLSWEQNWINDIVIDPERGVAYITDTGAGPDGHPGGLVVYDMNTRRSHRLEHNSMKPEPDAIDFQIGGDQFRFPVPVNGIGLSPDKTLLHYCALGGFTVYQMPTSAARDPDANLNVVIRAVGRKPSQSDGILMTYESLYFGCIAGDECQSAVAHWPYRKIMNETGKRLDELTMGDDAYEIFYPRNDTTMTWPNSFSIENGYLWIVSNRINEFATGKMQFPGPGGANFRIARYPFPDDRSYLSSRGGNIGPSSNVGHLEPCYLTLLLLCGFSTIARFSKL